MYTDATQLHAAAETSAIICRLVDLSLQLQRQHPLAIARAHTFACSLQAIEELLQQNSRLSSQTTELLHDIPKPGAAAAMQYQQPPPSRVNMDIMCIHSAESRELCKISCICTLCMQCCVPFQTDTLLYTACGSFPLPCGHHHNPAAPPAILNSQTSLVNDAVKNVSSYHVSGALAAVGQWRGARIHLHADPICI